MLSYKERRKIRDEEMERAAAKKQEKRSPLNYSAVVSTAALLVSGISAYYANFYNKHSVVVAPGEIDGAVFFGHNPSETDKFVHQKFRPVFSNVGNHAQVIYHIGVDLAFYPC